MRPLIGLSCSTLISNESDRLGMKRFAVPAFYVSRVEEAGALAVLLPSGSPEAAAEVVQRLDGLLLSGGADVDPDLYGQVPHARLGEVDRARDLFEMALIQAARRVGLPILAICRGMQVANVTYGGTLVQDVATQIAGSMQHDQHTTELTQTGHGVKLEPGTALHALAGANQVRVNSNHHQAVDRLAEGFRVTARAADGVVEAMEHVEAPFFQCVQWHPERLAGEALTRSLFQAFVKAAQPLARATGGSASASHEPTAPGAAPARRSPKALTQKPG